MKKYMLLCCFALIFQEPPIAWAQTLPTSRAQTQSHGNTSAPEKANAVLQNFLASAHRETKINELVYPVGVPS